MALQIPVFIPKASERLAATLNSPPLTWIEHSCALRKGTMPGSRRWTSAPSDRKSSAPVGLMFSGLLMWEFARVDELRVVSSGGHSTTAAGPIGVEEFAARLVDALVGVSA